MQNEIYACKEKVVKHVERMIDKKYQNRTVRYEPERG
jgi:hypothetical protein